MFNSALYPSGLVAQEAVIRDYKGTGTAPNYNFARMFICLFFNLQLPEPPTQPPTQLWRVIPL